MKVFIGLALLSVAFATPLVRPITLPEAPQPAVEMGIELPKPELPAFEEHDYLPIFERADIRPLLIPQEIVDALRQLGEAPFDIPVDTIQVVEIAESIFDDSHLDDVAPVDAVIVVDNIEEAPLNQAAEDVVDSVRFVDNAEDMAEAVPLEEAHDDEALLEEAPVNADAAIVVEHISFEDASLEASDDQVEPAGLREAPSVIEDAVIVYDHFEEAPEDAPVDADSVIVVDHVQELAEDTPVNGDSVIVVDDIDMPSEDAPVDSEVAADPVHFVDASLPADLENIVSEVLGGHVATDNTVKVVDMPAYPGKYYDNPLLR